MNDFVADLFADLFTAARAIDALDILICAYLIYRILLILKGSRALRVLAGLTVLGLLYGLGRVLQLTTIVWLFERFSFYAALVVIILFQEDIRRALARVGNPFLGGGSASEPLSVYQSIAKACFRLADQGHGALIAVERDADLEELFEQATELDAVLSDGLLVAIFQPASPVHDGAVIIREDRIAVAGAFFKLSTSPDIPRELGTRHRAAIGQTEDVDCMVFVVSEERRLVSIAFGGQLHNVDSPDELRLKVTELLDDARTAEPTFATGAFAPVLGTKTPTKDES